MGHADWEIRPDSSDRGKYFGHSLLLQPPGVQNCVLPGGSHRGWGITRGSWPGCEGPAGGMDCRIYMLPQARHGELRNRFWCTSDPAH